MFDTQIDHQSSNMFTNIYIKKRLEETIRIQKNSCTSSPESTFVQVAEASVFWRCDFTGDLVRLLFGVPPTLVMALPNDWLDFALCRECDLSSHTVLTNGGGGC